MASSSAVSAVSGIKLLSSVRPGGGIVSEVGGRSEARAEILRGLAAGERVVTTGAYGVTDSTRVGTPPSP